MERDLLPKKEEKIKHLQQNLTKDIGKNNIL